MALGASNSLQPHLAYLNHPKALVTSESYHVVITTSIPLNTTSRQLERNRGKYSGRGSLTSGKRCRVEVNTWKMIGCSLTTSTNHLFLKT